MARIINVKALRRRLKLTQAEFAAKLEVNQSTVQRWEKKTRAPRGPARQRIMQLAVEGC